MCCRRFTLHLFWGFTTSYNFYCWPSSSRSPPGFSWATPRQKPTSLTSIWAKAQLSSVATAPRSWVPSGKLWRTLMTSEGLWPSSVSCMLTSSGWTPWTSRWVSTETFRGGNSHHKIRDHRSLMAAWSLTVLHSQFLIWFSTCDRVF